MSIKPLPEITAEQREAARGVQRSHVPSGPEGWEICQKCAQVSVGGSETSPVWPCDARRLADKILGDS